MPPAVRPHRHRGKQDAGQNEFNVNSMVFECCIDPSGAIPSSSVGSGENSLLGCWAFILGCVSR